MSLLGTMMVRAGLLSDEQLAAVQATSAERKLSFVEALLAHGFADEDSVVGFLHSKLMIPKVGASILEGVDRTALDRVPGDLAARHAVLPISSDETGNLTLAMVDPTDMKAVDAISAHTGAYLVRAVAPLRIIRSSITRHYGIEAPPLPSLHASRPAGAPAPAAIIPPTAPVPNASSAAGRAAVITAPSVSPPSVTAPTVAAPTVAPPVAAPSVAVPTAAAATAAPPVAAPSVAAPSVAAPSVTPPAVEPVPALATPAAASAPRPAAPSGAAIRPAAVIQPSAVLMPGAPRPAAVLPAAAFAPSPYGIPVQPTAPTAPTAVAPAVEAPVAPVSSASSPAAQAAQASAATPASSVSPSAAKVTQQLVSASLTPPPAAAAPVSSVSPAQPLGSSSLAAAVAATPVSSVSPAASAAAVASPAAAVEADGVHRSSAPTMAVFSGAMATLRPHEPAELTARSGVIDDDADADALAGARSADVVDIPLDDLESDRTPTAAPTGPTSEFDAAKTATWIPPSFTAANEIVPLSPEAFHRLLPRFATVKTRDEVTDLLLDFLAEGFSRVIMFVHVKGEIRGRDARGEDLLVEAVRQIRIPAGGPSVFSGVIERRAPYFGPMRTDTPIDAAFFSALGGVEGVILVLPVLLRDKVPLIVFASGSSNPVDPRSLHELTHEVAAALERIIVLEKSRGK